MGIVALTLIAMPACANLCADKSACASDCTDCTTEQKAECAGEGACDKAKCETEKKAAQCCADAKALGKDCDSCAK